MSYANVKSFILILLLGAIHGMVIRPKDQPAALGARGGFGAAAGGMGGGMTGGLSGYSGLADIGVDINDFNGGANQNFGAGSGSAPQNIGDIGLGDLTSGGNNLWKEFQDIISSVGGAASSNDISNIGFNANDFQFGSGAPGSNKDTSGASRYSSRT